MIEIPPAFRRATVEREGDEGRRWLETLPDRCAALLSRWQLARDGPAMHGYVGLVLPVVRDGEPCVLKVSWIDRWTEHEIDALETWDGDGAVRLLRADRAAGVLLLERLDARRDLRAVAGGEAVEIAGLLLRRLAVAAPRWARSWPEELAALSDVFERSRGGEAGRFGTADRERVLATVRELGSMDPDRLVNVDLHHENVLAGRREPWLAIDPKVVTAPVEYGVAPLLWQDGDEVDSASRLEERLATVVRAAGLNADLARACTYVRAMEAAIWADERGHDRAFGARCERLTRWLMP